MHLCHFCLQLKRHTNSTCMTATAQSFALPKFPPKVLTTHRLKLHEQVKSVQRHSGSPMNRDGAVCLTDDRPESSPQQTTTTITTGTAAVETLQGTLVQLKEASASPPPLRYVSGHRRSSGNKPSLRRLTIPSPQPSQPSSGLVENTQPQQQLDTPLWEGNMSTEQEEQRRLRRLMVHVTGKVDNYVYERRQYDLQKQTRERQRSGAGTIVAGQSIKGAWR